MYILTNALKNLTRNKGRNLLLSAIILAIIATTVVTLSITNTSESIIDGYRQSIGSRVFITPDMDAVREAQREAQRIAGVPFTSPSVTPQQSLAFARSQYVREFALNATHFAGNDELIAVDSVAERPPMQMFSGHEEHPDLEEPADYIVTPNFRIMSNWIDDFESGQRRISEGRMPQADGEALISTELAELNDLSVGDVMRLYANLTAHGETRKIYRDLTISGIYLDMTENPFAGMINIPIINRRNEILTTLNTILADVGEYDSGFTISSVFYLYSPSYLPAFETEARTLGLDDMLLVLTNEAEYYATIAPIEGLRSIAQTFMLVVLILGGVVLMILSSIAIRERKYEIGVLRAMGMKKHKVAAGLWLEMLTLTAICLVIGLSVGSVVSQPISDTLLAGQLENLAVQNGGGMQFGAPTDGGNLQLTLDPRADSYTPIDAMDVFLGARTILEIIGISLLLTTLAALVAIIKITKYEPIKILMERE